MLSSLLPLLILPTFWAPTGCSQDHLSSSYQLACSWCVSNLPCLMDRHNPKACSHILFHQFTPHPVLARYSWSSPSHRRHAAPLRARMLGVSTNTHSGTPM
ncbi:hypothetical protein HBH56_037100 [Parastagonospora nodorum]|uniref:Secreted protein n=1 Tax=Phaeosphaeria nodorum (strain SN15 / ATCC MYA-4574 / FGSC 10173) TaxID=321614 RepID=A0A7U2I4X7_PHANO|nr:hypothetical protein HBH56_037100 [Parastagonospora nodorum]QRC99976.1 hypothetical protein JI435_414340 [Parastagonospora nodorum SN15]KAH3933934.1 hypothetical protein HBH54_062370 [Parastagonospora nodorum]KAH3952551.1 hypothetical protein HBH53_047750 [Parastagonospora nodorum]KAH3979997.1 hypothetical protein HBH52_094900 [Parastagonospora nodorum]